MNEAQAWREIAEKYATEPDYSLWLRIHDVWVEGKIDKSTQYLMVLRIQLHHEASRELVDVWSPPIDGCLFALFMALESLGYDE
jgi:hypothetical protein